MSRDHADTIRMCRKCDLPFEGMSELRTHQWAVHPKIFAKNFAKKTKHHAAANGAGNELIVPEVKLIPVAAPARQEMTVSQFIVEIAKQRDFLTNVIDLAKGYAHDVPSK